MAQSLVPRALQAKKQPDPAYSAAVRVAAAETAAAARLAAEAKGDKVVVEVVCVFERVCDEQIPLKSHNGGFGYKFTMELEINGHPKRGLLTSRAFQDEVAVAISPSSARSHARPAFLSSPAEDISHRRSCRLCLWG